MQHLLGVIRISYINLCRLEINGHEWLWNVLMGPPFSPNPTNLYLSHIYGLVQERRNTTAIALELHLSCTNPSIWSRIPGPLILVWPCIVLLMDGRSFDQAEQIRTQERSHIHWENSQTTGENGNVSLDYIHTTDHECDFYLVLQFILRKNMKQPWSIAVLPLFLYRLFQIVIWTAFHQHYLYLFDWFT